MAVVDANFETLGQLVYDRLPEDVPRILLYVEFVGDGVVSASLFYQTSNGGLYYADPDPEYVEDDLAIDKELFNLQKVFDEDVKALEFEIRGDRFSTRFVYADEFDTDIDRSARTDAALRRCFGHTSVHYKSL